MEQFYDKVSASAAYIRAHIPQTPTVGIILGSGPVSYTHLTLPTN